MQLSSQYLLIKSMNFMTETYAFVQMNHFIHKIYINGKTIILLILFASFFCWYYYVFVPLWSWNLIFELTENSQAGVFFILAKRINTFGDLISGTIVWLFAF